MSNAAKKIELITASIAATIALTTLLATHPHKKETNNSIIELDLSQHADANLKQNSNETSNELSKKQTTKFNFEWRTINIKPGDTLKSVLSDLHIPKKNIKSLLKTHSHKETLLTAGKKIRFITDQNKNLITAEIPLASNKILEINANNNGYQQKTLNLPVTKKLVLKTSTIYSSVTQATKKAGVSTKLSHQLVDIFKTNVDFNKHANAGDHFAILYNEDYVAGKKIHSSDILAAELKTHNKTYNAIQFTYPKSHTSYYTPQGHSIEHKFLPYPVQFKRISSNFSRNRLDPIVHAVRPHLGIDFAADIGTPIHSIGDGRITFIGHDSGYGNAIKIRYDRHYTALYAHMKQFTHDLKLHEYVKKGQIIGYVGSTGWSTGPHLHFGFYVDGIAANWLTIDQPVNPPIPKKYLHEFIKTAKNLLAALKTPQTTTLAANTTALPISDKE